MLKWAKIFRYPSDLQMAVDKHANFGLHGQSSGLLLYMKLIKSAKLWSERHQNTCRHVFFKKGIEISTFKNSEPFETLFLIVVTDRLTNLKTKIKLWKFKSPVQWAVANRQKMY